ncbi:DUF6003 family protein [Streptomyces avermitilis]|uniref:DUF6003 family protein n=1 Tax=Streptomyces avermitilis TaxID=33903 RepID=UPI00380BF7A2
MSEAELSRLPHHNAPEAVARLEEELVAYRDCTDGRATLLRRAGPRGRSSPGAHRGTDG